MAIRVWDRLKTKPQQQSVEAAATVQHASVIDDHVSCELQRRAARDLVHVVGEVASRRIAEPLKLRILPREIELPSPDRKCRQIHSDVKGETVHRAVTTVWVGCRILESAPDLSDQYAGRRWVSLFRETAHPRDP